MNPTDDQDRSVVAGRYVLQGLLGSGGMADVELAYDEVLNRQVAVKMLHAKYASDDLFVERFRREAQSAAALSSPNVVAVYDTGTDHGRPFIVMEYVAGRSLREILRQDTISPTRAAEIAAEVAQALGYAHERGIIHRDIKPGNIMVADSGHVKVTDFGIARAANLDSVTQTSAVFGTAAYVAPEQAKGLKVDGRTDLYALGCVLFEMLTGRQPFTGDSPITLAYKHVSEAPARPSSLNPEIPASLEAVTLKAMAKQPSGRYSTGQTFANDLRRAIAGLSISTTPDQAYQGMQPAPQPTTQGTTMDVDPNTGGYATDPNRLPPEATQAYAPDAPTTVTPNSPHAPTQIAGMAPGAGQGAGQGATQMAGQGAGHMAGQGATQIAGHTSGPLGTQMTPQAAYDEPIAYDANYDPDYPAHAGFGQPVQPQDLYQGYQDHYDEQYYQAAYDDDWERETQSHRGQIIAYTLIGVLITVLLIVAGVFVNNMLNNRAIPTTSKVPDVTGQAFANAQSMLINAGLQPAVGESVASETIPANSVVSTVPPKGTEVEHGSTVQLILSKGFNSTPVPNVANFTRSQAEQMLGEAGFTIGTVERQPSPTVLKGLVISTNPAAGMTVDKDTNRTVNIIISSGKETFPMPDVTNMTETVATELILKSCSSPTPCVTVRTMVDPDTYGDGKVISTNPLKDSAVELGTTITLTLSSTQKPKPVVTPSKPAKPTAAPKPTASEDKPVTAPTPAPPTPAPAVETDTNTDT